MADGVTGTVQDPNVEVQENQTVTMEQFNALKEQFELEKGKTSSLDKTVAKYQKEIQERERSLEELKTSKMTESERLQMELEKIKLDFQTEQLSRTKADNKAKALEIMAENGIDKRFIDFIPLDNADLMAERLKSLSELAADTMRLGAKQVVNKLGVSVPTGGTPVGGAVTMEQYLTLSEAEQDKVLREGRLQK